MTITTKTPFKGFEAVIRVPPRGYHCLKILIRISHKGFEAVIPPNCQPALVSGLRPPAPQKSHIPRTGTTSS